MHFGSDVLWWKVLLFLHSCRITEFDLREQTCQRCSWFRFCGEPTKDKNHSLKTSFKNIRTSKEVQIEEVKAGFFFFVKWWSFEEICSTTGEKSCMLTDQFPRLELTAAIAGLLSTPHCNGLAPFHYSHWLGLIFIVFLCVFSFMLSKLMWEFVRKDKGPAPEIRNTKPHLSHMQDGCRVSWEIQPGSEFK